MKRISIVHCLHYNNKRESRILPLAEQSNNESQVIHITGIKYNECITPFLINDYDEAIAKISQRICEQFEITHLLDDSTNLIDVKEAAITESIISALATKFNISIKQVQIDVSEIAQILIDSMILKYDMTNEHVSSAQAHVSLVRE